MLNIKDVNNEVFNYLESVRTQNTKLRYTFRKSNYNNRLSDGYWFYGTEQYMAVSFWTGMDWRNRSPNICFLILENGLARLEINVSDSDKKREFVEKYLIDPLHLYQEGRRYFKDYSDVEEAYIDALSYFLEGNKSNNVVSDKFLID